MNDAQVKRAWSAPRVRTVEPSTPAVLLAESILCRCQMSGQPCVCGDPGVPPTCGVCK